MKPYWIIIYMLSPLLSLGQASSTLELDDYIRLVYEYHPIIKNARLLQEKSNAIARQAKGELDPTIDVNYNQKSFDDKNYYQKLSGLIKVPSKLGIDVYGGYESNDGIFLNNENNLPIDGLAFGGISVPIGKGLFYNKRRKIIEEASIIRSLNDIESQTLINELLAEATYSYVEWQYAYQSRLLYQEAYDIAQIRYDNTIAIYNTGDGPAIDTLEAKVNLNSRSIDLQSSIQEEIQAKNNLELYLWTDDAGIIELSPTTIPQVLSQDIWTEDMIILESQWLTIIPNLPSILKFENYEDKLNIERRLINESLKPELNLKLNALLQINENDKVVSYNRNDYKLGVDFYYPIFNRKAKGAQQAIDIDIESNSNDQMLKQQSIYVYAQNMMIEIQALNSILEQSIINQDDRAFLLEIENDKFSIGESSVFLVNSRELKLLDTKLKVATIKQKLLNKKIGFFSLLFQLEEILEL